jgi:hypothetical protein
MKNKKHNNSQNNKYLYALAPIVFLIIMLFALGNAKFNYNFNTQGDINKFKFYNSTIDSSMGGVELSSIQTTAVIFNDKSELSKTSWQKTPYIKLFINPESFARTIAIFWSPNKSLKQIHQRVVNIPAYSDEVIINTHQNLLWQRIFPWKDNVYGDTTIHSFGLLVSQQYQKSFILQKIELLPNLSVIDYIKTIANELTTDEGVRVNSINAQYGVSVLGVHLAYILGVVLIIAALPILFRYSQKNLNIFVTTSLVCVVIYFIPTITTLINHAKDSSKISAFHKNKYTEYKSRFGQNFADLSKQLEEKIPKKSKVHFAFSKDYRVRGESNWIAFQYYGIYAISNLDDAKYIFYYHPRDITFDKSKKLVSHNNKQYKVKIIAEVNGSYILEKIYE